ncbi:MAG: hypothetical protein OEY92_02390 [Elusimicrobiota bacterium]|nr:hypothetical protein [Elusimicrobiota bacterium]
MTLRKTKQSSVLLQKAQIEFLRNLAKRIEKESHKKMSRSEIIRVLMKTVTCIKPDVGECRSEKEIERELLKCLKKTVRELKR